MKPVLLGSNYTTSVGSSCPVKSRRVKHKRLPEWSNQEILTTRKLRDISKRHGNWPDYKKYRNKTETLIRQHFSEAVTNLKYTKSIWKHLRTANKKTSACDNLLPDELEINGQQYTNSQDIAFKLNDYFASISEYINTNDVISSAPDLTKLETHISSKIPTDMFFRIPKITVNQVAEFINGLNPAKATGLDGKGPRILKLASTVLSPSITALINKSIETATLPDQLNQKSNCTIFIKVAQNLIQPITDRFLSFQRFQNFSKNT